MKTLGLRFENFVMERTEDAGKVIIQNEEYQSLGAKILSLMKEIESHLPVDKKHLIDELECCNSSQAGLVEIEVYKQGLKDGIKFNEFLDR